VCAGAQKIHRRLWAGKRSLSAIKQHWYLLEELDDGDEGDLDESGEDQVDEVDREEKVDEDLAVGGEEEVDEDRFRETLHGITVFVDTPILRRASELASLLAEQDRVFLASWDKVFCRKAVHVDRGLELRSGTQRSDIVRVPHSFRLLLSLRCSTAPHRPSTAFRDWRR